MEFKYIIWIWFFFFWNFWNSKANLEIKTSKQKWGVKSASEIARAKIYKFSLIIFLNRQLKNFIDRHCLFVNWSSTNERLFVSQKIKYNNLQIFFGLDWHEFGKMFLWDWFTGVLKGLGLMNKSGIVICSLWL